MEQDLEKLALAVRDRCVRELIAAYEEAGFVGLCGEGRWEYALDRVRHLKTPDLISLGKGLLPDF